MKKINNRKGFTLVEIIVVLVILAILAAIAVPSVLWYVEEAKAIYTVIQVEETKLANEIDYTDIPSKYNRAEEYMYAKICDKSDFNKVGEGIVSQKTGIPKVSNIHSSNDSKMYILNWTSEDGKIIDAQITKNKKVDILSVNNN